MIIAIRENRKAAGLKYTNDPRAVQYTFFLKKYRLDNASTRDTQATP
jgi:hypothetical protein